MPQAARAVIGYGESVEPSQLDVYFERIGYRGSREPTLEVLHALTAAHTRHIPFENLDVLLGRAIELTPAALFEKLVVRRRGGYCFEQNGFFLDVLSTLGFAVTPLSARVRLDRPRDFMPARTHLTLRVQIGEDVWLTDVGVGAASLTAAIRLDPGLEQLTPHEARRVVHEDGRYFHQIRYGAHWADVYEFTGDVMPLIDRVVGNWYTSTHPQSPFKTGLRVARADEHGRRFTLSNRELKIREHNGQATARILESNAALLDVLAEYFGLHFEQGTRFPILNFED